MTRSHWLLASLLFLGCGGSSSPPPSIDRSKAVTALSDQERQDFCAWETAAEGGEGSKHDCGGTTFQAPTVARCVATIDALPAACSSVTYGEVKDCADQNIADVCHGSVSAACQRAIADLSACAPGAAHLMLHD